MPPTKLSLKEARIQFTLCLARLIIWASQRDLLFALDEATERLTPADPTSDHRKGSLHHIGLAADLLLYENGVYQTSTEAHRLTGSYWESLHPLARWGGHFGDGNHYSFEWEGRK